MSIKEQLQICEKLKREITELEEQAAEIESSLFYSSAMPHCIRVQETRRNNEEIKRVALIDTKKKIEERREHLGQLRANLLAAISNISNTKQKTLLVIKYILCTTNARAAEIMQCDERHFYRIREKAIQAAEMAYKATTAPNVEE